MSSTWRRLPKMARSLRPRQVSRAVRISGGMLTSSACDPAAHASFAESGSIDRFLGARSWPLSCAAFTANPGSACVSLCCLRAGADRPSRLVVGRGCGRLAGSPSVVYSANHGRENHAPRQRGRFCPRYIHHRTHRHADRGRTDRNIYHRNRRTREGSRYEPLARHAARDGTILWARETPPCIDLRPSDHRLCPDDSGWLSHERVRSLAAGRGEEQPGERGVPPARIAGKGRYLGGV